MPAARQSPAGASAARAIACVRRTMTAFVVLAGVASGRARAGEAAWPVSDRQLDWLAVDQHLPLYVNRPNIEPEDAAIISAIEVHRNDPWPTFDPAANYYTAAFELNRYNPGIVLGSAISGGDLRAVEWMQSYPDESIHFEDVPNPAFVAGPAWATPDLIPRYAVDLTSPAARAWFAGALVNEMAWRRATLPPPPIAFAFLDNIRYPDSGFQIPRGPCRLTKCFERPPPEACQCVSIPWTDSIDFLTQVRTGLEPLGMKLVVNVAGPPCGWRDAPEGRHSDLLAGAVDGMMFEQPFEKESCRLRPDHVLREIEIYRSWLSAGKLVLWVPVQCENSLQCAECDPHADPQCNACASETPYEDERRLMAAMAMLIREPGQSLFVVRDFFRPRPEWWDWPRDFGPPLGPMQLLSGQGGGEDIVLTRSFERGDLTVNLTQSVCAASFSQALDVRIAPSIELFQPSPRVACAGRTVTFRLILGGTPPFSYQWFRDGEPIPGAVQQVYWLNNVTSADSGAYSVTVSNVSGVASSAVESLVVYDWVRGDINGDGLVTNFDIEPFIDLLVGENDDPRAICAGDINQDYRINNFDLDAFIALLVGGG